MRYLPFIFIVCLLLPCLTYAQDDAPILAADDYLFRLPQGEDPEILLDSNWFDHLLSPDGQWLAYTSRPDYLIDQDIEPDNYPSNLSVVNITSGAITPLLIQQADDTDMLIYSGKSRKYIPPYVKALPSWKMPDAKINTLYMHIAWSPDSRFVAHLQTIVKNGGPTEVRLVTFDIASGDMRIIADFGPSTAPYALFWFDTGLVLYSQQAWQDDTVTVFDPAGKVLHAWTVSKELNSENPVRYEGKDYLYFGSEFLYDVSTNEFQPIEGTLALVSAKNPAQSLVVEACNIVRGPYYTWDVYTSGGDKLFQLKESASVALSPDGQQLAYTSSEEFHITSVMIFDGTDRSYYLKKNGKKFTSINVMWAPMIYTITDVGAQDCSRPSQN